MHESNSVKHMWSGPNVVGTILPEVMAFDIYGVGLFTMGTTNE